MSTALSIVGKPLAESLRASVTTGGGVCLMRGPAAGGRAAGGLSFIPGCAGPGTVLRLPPDESLLELALANILYGRSNPALPVLEELALLLRGSEEVLLVLRLATGDDANL